MIIRGGNDGESARGKEETGSTELTPKSDRATALVSKRRPSEDWCQDGAVKASKEREVMQGLH